MEQIIKIRLNTGEERECDYYSVEEMFADTESKNEIVIEWWSTT